MRYSYLRKRNAAFHTLRSLLLGVVSRHPPTPAGDIGYLRPLTGSPFTHTRKIPALLRTGRGNGQTTVTQYYSLFVSCYVACRACERTSISSYGGDRYVIIDSMASLWFFFFLMMFLKVLFIIFFFNLIFEEEDEMGLGS